MDPRTRRVGFIVDLLEWKNGTEGFQVWLRFRQRNPVNSQNPLVRQMLWADAVPEMLFCLSDQNTLDINFYIAIIYGFFPIWNPQVERLRTKFDV
jgi:hypothetical protein